MIYIYIYICAYVLYTGTCCITDCISIQYIYISTYTHICNVHSILHTHTDEVCDPKGAFIGIRQGQLGVKRASVKH